MTIDVPPPAPQPAASSPAAPLPASDGPLVVGQDWSGRYTCGRGDMLMIVHVEKVEGARVSGVFLFRHTPTGAAGSFEIAGVFDAATGRLTLAPGAWIDRPDGFETTGLSGVVRGRRFEGRIEQPGCGAFAADLTDSLPTGLGAE